MTGRFIDTGAKSAMKMPVSVLDTAATVSSYSSSFVKSLDTTTVSDLYNYMTGLKKSGNTGYDITLRGFKGSGDDRNTILVDGLPGLTVRYGSPGTVNIDHIELVQGPTSVLYGQAQPGGFVNLVTKSPLGHFEASVEQRVNSYAGSGLPLGRRNGIEDEFDVTGPITRSGNLLFRVTGQISDIQSFRDGALASSSEFIAPALTWKINPGTSLTVKAEYGHVRQHLDNGVVAPANGNIYDVSRAAPRTASYQQPDDFRGETGKTVSAFLHHDFGGGWQFHASYRHVSYNSDQKSFDQYGTLTVQGVAEVQRRARELVTNRSYDYGDINLNGHFKTGFIKHKILIGLNLGSNSTENNRIKFFN
ncbi:MAG TPA: TonB-dependent receptor plug domain-containing protein, partial [Novosphingobium sp.]|nr:TonB-dependent receptor plug domain-containing protein [Novosphingobium sp.]